MEIPDPFAFDTHLNPTRFRCRNLIYDIFERSLALYDSAQQGIDGYNARVSYVVEGIDTDEGRPLLRIREAVYATAERGTHLSIGVNNVEHATRNEQVFGEPRAYILETALKPESDEQDEDDDSLLEWQSFGCIIMHRKDNRNIVDLFDHETGAEMTDIDIEAVHDVLRVMDDSLREELVQGHALTDPESYQAPEEPDTNILLKNLLDFEPGRLIRGLACPICDDLGQFCPHITGNLN